MFDEGVTSVAVIDEYGRLAASLSGSDMRGLSQDKIHTLDMGVFELLAAGGIHNPERKKEKKLITCTAADKLIDVLEKIVTSREHRVRDR